MIAIAADCSETFHDCLSKGFKSACKRPESGASRNPSKSELEVEWHSAQEKNRSEAQETKLSGPATFDYEHQSTHGFPLAEKGDAPICEWIFLFRAPPEGRIGVSIYTGEGCHLGGII